MRTFVTGVYVQWYCTATLLPVDTRRDCLTSRNKVTLGACISPTFSRPGRGGARASKDSFYSGAHGLLLFSCLVRLLSTTNATHKSRPREHTSTPTPNPQTRTNALTADLFNISSRQDRDTIDAQSTGSAPPPRRPAAAGSDFRRGRKCDP